jgi:predicted DCC family thiol-disulfide oxidoreductase YuxK
MNNSNPVILFDGVCNLCNSSVDWIIRRDQRGHFRYGSLQSDSGQEILKTHHYDQGDLSTIVLEENGKLYFRSTAVLRILKSLGAAWPILYYLFIWIPPQVRDVVYRWIAANRYRWFGQRESCRLPTEQERALFV